MDILKLKKLQKHEKNVDLLIFNHVNLKYSLLFLKGTIYNNVFLNILLL